VSHEGAATVTDFDNGWVIVRVVNATLGIVCVVWMVVLMNTRATQGPGWATRGRRLMSLSHLLGLVVITMAQVRNVHAGEPLNVIAWLVVGLMVLTFVACHEATRDMLRHRRESPPD
jgi:hypothetical protein